MSCSHPEDRQFAATARDDTIPSGAVLWVACCDCGEVIEDKPLPWAKKKRIPAEHMGVVTWPGAISKVVVRGGGDD